MTNKISKDTDKSTETIELKSNNNDMHPTKKKHEKQEKDNQIINNLQDEVKNIQDLYIREKAENDNLRKRFQKDLEDTHKFAISKFAKNITEQVEDLFRALENINIESCKTNNELSTLFNGIEITKKNLLKVFKEFKIERIYPINRIFDHRFHEAISQIVNKEKENNTINNVIQAGYTIEGRLLRPAVVIVTKQT